MATFLDRYIGGGKMNKRIQNNSICCLFLIAMMMNLPASVTHAEVVMDGTLGPQGNTDYLFISKETFKFYANGTETIIIDFSKCY